MDLINEPKAEVRTGRPAEHPVRLGCVILDEPVHGPVALSGGIGIWFNG